MSRIILLIPIFLASSIPKASRLSSTPTMPRPSPRVAAHYLLPFHVHFCLVAEGAIFLDLRHDKYFALDSAQTSALLTLAGNRSPFDQTLDGEQCRCAARGTEIGDALVEIGLLTRCSTAGRPISPAPSLPARDELWPFDVHVRSPLRFSELRRFLKAYLRVSISIRLGGLERLARRIAQRKSRAPQGSGEIRPETTRRLLAAYQTLQALTFTAKHACLFDSLLLIEFLAQHEVYATWMVGVRTGPFASHSWVQHDTDILNGTKQYIQRFTPILAI